MKKIISLLLSLMMLSSCSISPSSNTDGSNNKDTSSFSSETIEQYVTATFVVGEGVDPIESQKVALGKKFIKPKDPTREKYTFGGWYKDLTYTSEFDFNIAYETNQTIYAKWDLITYEYYLYGVLNDTEVFLPNIYMQEQYRLKTPREEDKDAIVALYDWHIMPSDELHIRRFGSDDTEVVYDHERPAEGYGRGYYDILFYEDGITLRFHRYDKWVINFLDRNDEGEVFASFTETTAPEGFAHYEAKGVEVKAGQRLFLSYAYEYNPTDYFGVTCSVIYPIDTTPEEWIQVVHVQSVHWPNGSTTVYEFQQAAKYDVIVIVNENATVDVTSKVQFIFTQE